MKTRMEFQGSWVDLDWTKPLDISIPLVPNTLTPNCFYAPPLEAFPVKTADFVGSIDQGSPVNFYNLRVNPHGNGTHTESVGHIKEGEFPIANTLERFGYFAKLISVYPTKKENGDRVISADTVAQVLDNENSIECLVVRTLPNDEGKKKRNYSGSNPPYFEKPAIEQMVEAGVKHLLTDLPSVDREEDGGKLAAHKAFWKFYGKLRTDCSITELIYVDNHIKDGWYFLHFQVLNLHLDASPSRPVLYELIK